MRRIIYSIVAIGLIFTGCAGMKGQGDNNGWKSLFDGKDINDWFVAKGKVMGTPLEGKFRYFRVWKRIDNTLKVIGASFMQLP
ncbi:hypothetical protein ACR784_18070 [Sphingobacterium multivorum]|uniref:Uncharacterized protein n=1 Tax=Sphingobacterium thalpophilum TaxID=259 RepID=A0ACD5C0T5_9SPHI